MPIVTINKHVLKALSLCAGTGESRPELRGVRIADSMIFATNSHIAGWLHLSENFIENKLGWEEEAKKINTFIPIAIVSSVLKIIPKNQDLVFINTDAQKIEQTSYISYDEKTVALRGVLPKHTTFGCVQQFDPIYLKKITDIHNTLLKTKYTYVNENGKRVAPYVMFLTGDTPVSVCRLFFPAYPPFNGLIMPLRTDNKIPDIYCTDKELQTRNKAILLPTPKRITKNE